MRVNTALIMLELIHQPQTLLEKKVRQTGEDQESEEQGFDGSFQKLVGIFGGL